MVPAGKATESTVQSLAAAMEQGDTIIDGGNSVIGSWLLDLTSMALAENPSLSNFTGFVEGSGEDRWTINAAI